MHWYYNPGKLLRQVFPEQTKSALHIVIWTIIFIADLVAVFFLLDHFGISWFGANASELYLILLIGGGLVLFGIETFVYNKLHALFR